MILNDSLPKGMPFINGLLKKKGVGQLVNYAYLRFGLETTVRMLDGIKQSDPRVSDPQSHVKQQPDYAKNEFRSLKPDVMVLVGVCTHLGCSPQLKSGEAKAEMGGDWPGGFYCPCHGSKFDFAGRVFKGSPAPLNLVVPPYTLVSESKIVIGEDEKTKGA